MADYRLPVGIHEDSILEAAHNRDVVLIAMGTHGKIGWDRLRLGRKREKADLIVVGTHGRRGMKQLMLGSVAKP